ncbi:MAG: hypothetical protein H6937_01810 [Burkholderiales bacterium]|nr:hypothetical protein [Burkholderiales bacterium]MDR4517888.1 hypothetical protein [Nitrosomonas sp.]
MTHHSRTPQEDNPETQEFEKKWWPGFGLDKTAANGEAWFEPGEKISTGKRRKLVNMPV